MPVKQSVKSERRRILVSASIIADISSGIYRTPANALKELVSNAFDADAHDVVINTGHPQFEAMTCIDDGRGMSAAEFQKYMSSIGGSYKRATGQFTQSGTRPLIGKIGIGVLAVGQICRRFTVISSAGDGECFEAEIDLKEFHDVEAHKQPLGSTEIGEYTCEVYDEEREKHYTKIILEDINEGFRAGLLEGQNPKSKINDYKAKIGHPIQFDEFVHWLRGKKIRDLSEYDQLMWGLAIAAPIQYLDEGPILGYSGFRDVRRRLKKYDFRVEVDGLALRKPLLLPFDRTFRKMERDYWVYDDISFRSEVDGTELSFTGYVYAQRKRIVPPECQGILIRIRNVAIGDYDKTIMSYPKSEGPRLSLVSGEIYVDEGLEGALNIDRNSFNETHPHYLALRTYVFDRFGREGGIFSDLKKRSRERRKGEQQVEAKLHYDTLSRIIQEITGIRYTISSSDEKSDRPIAIDAPRRRILVFRSPIFPRKASERRIFESLLILFEVAYKHSTDKPSLHQSFLKLVEELA